MPYIVKIKNECLNKHPKNNQTYMPYMVKMNASVSCIEKINLYALHGFNKKTTLLTPTKKSKTYMPYMVIIKMNTSIIHPVIVKLMPYMVIIKKPIPIKEPASDIYF
jgi:hypothetical protein